MKTGILHRIDEDLKNMELDLSGPKDHPVAENETIAGVIEDESIKRLYAVHAVYAAKANAAKDQAMELGRKGEEDSDDFKAAVKEAEEYETRAGIVAKAFWQDVRDTFGLQDKANISLSDGWQVAWSDEVDKCANCPGAAMGCPGASRASEASSEPVELVK